MIFFWLASTETPAQAVALRSRRFYFVMSFLNKDFKDMYTSSHLKRRRPSVSSLTLNCQQLIAQVGNSWKEKSIYGDLREDNDITFWTSFTHGTLPGPYLFDFYTLKAV